MSIFIYQLEGSDAKDRRHSDTNKTLPRSGAYDVTFIAVRIIIIIKTISFVDPQRLWPRYFTISAEKDLLIIGPGWLPSRKIAKRSDEPMVLHTKCVSASWSSLSTNTVHTE